MTKAFAGRCESCGEAIGRPHRADCGEYEWCSNDGIAHIFYEPKGRHVVIDTFNHGDLTASLSADEARTASAALLTFADLAEDTA